MRQSLKSLNWILILFIWMWTGAFFFEKCLPKGWQFEWYGMPSMLTYLAILFGIMFVVIKKDKKT